MRSVTIIICVLFANLTFGQSKDEIKLLLDKIYLIPNSKNIKESEDAKKIIAYGKCAVPILELFLDDPTLTTVYSDLKKENLRKEEIAILLIDYVDPLSVIFLVMPACGSNHAEIRKRITVENIFTTIDNFPFIVKLYHRWKRITKKPEIS